MSQLHQAVNEIRDLRSQIQNLHKRFGDDPRLKPALAAAEDLDRKMSEVEQKLIQVNMKGSEANLAFPNMLNERFDTFSHTIETADTEPTKPQLDVFQMLSSQLDEQLKKWAQLKQEDVAKVSELVKQANLPTLHHRKEERMNVDSVALTRFWIANGEAVQIYTVFGAVTDAQKQPCFPPDPP